MSASKSPQTLTNLLVEDDDQSQQSKVDLLLSSLPKENYYGDFVYQYNGFWFVPLYLEGILRRRDHFQARDTDILLITSPKSGTTWLKAILFSLLNKGHYRAPDDQKHPLLSNNPHDLVPYLDMNLYSDKQVPDLTSLPSPRLFATHMPSVMLPNSVKNGSKCKLVYLCRDPKDTFVSLWHHLTMFRTLALNPVSPKAVAVPTAQCDENLKRNESRETSCGWESTVGMGGEISDFQAAFDRFCRGSEMYGPLWDHVLGYWRESLERPDKVLFLKYEDMKEKPDDQLRRIADFIGCPFSHEEESSGLVNEILKLCGFENLSNLEVNKSGRFMWCDLEKRALFRRGVVGDWKNCLTAKMASRIDQISEEKFYGSGLKF